MTRLGSYVLCGVLCSLVVLGQGDVTTKLPVTLLVNDTPVIPVDNSTTPATTTPAPTTPTSTTTAPPPTTTTPPPDTTTPPPTPPTPAPAPSPAPSPAPAPGPLPPPEQGIWSYQDKATNVTCVVVQFAAQLNVTYAVNGSTNFNSVFLNVPKNATVLEGSCSGNTTQWLTLGWAQASSQLSNMTLLFQKNDTTKNYALLKMSVKLAPELFPNATSKTFELSHGSEWQTPLETSYRCAQSTRLNMTADPATSNVVAALTLSRLQEEAFRTSTAAGFSAARECGGGDMPDAVPIAVGCALGGLVLVVLAAYLIGRRRSAARGYLSM